MDKTNDTLHLFFAADVNYYQHLCVLIVSILENNPDEPFAFYVMTNRDDKEAEKIKGLANKYHNFDIRFIVMDDSLFEKFPLLIKHITLQMYYRFLIPLLAPELDKALYLDCDMVCNIGLRELWEIPLGNNYIGGCSVLKAEMIDPKAKEYLESIKYPNPHQAEKYICSGVLLMNLKKIRSDNKVSELLEWCRQTPHSKYTDQDAINCVFFDNIKLINLKWNYTTIAVGALRMKPANCILHFIGPMKPWKPTVICQLYSSHLYMKYWRRTPYRYRIIKYSMIRIFVYPFLLAQILFNPREILKAPERLLRWFVIKPLKRLFAAIIHKNPPVNK
ncbi:MAG: glycosyltransferase family 8 protein [Planctomycetaceae bacterium]|jgi:lipopolysaccharide biosynthesis glycosyltransferase|nr:glycosyltransferase family 8 protein [Planctomycetaceae bacterium]